jgi:endonuclease/exonuclease/phosphatase (EEP) superfamily protein YafD
VEAVARFLEAERADAVVLQEAYHLHGALIERVEGSYPHSYCPDEDCTVALLSRMRPLQVGKEDVPPRKPLLVWAEIPFGERTVKVVGLHLPFPFDPEYQAEHVEWLIDHMWQHPRATAVAGDFNLTPFSLKLVKLMRWTGLRAHLTWQFSWPTHMGFPLVLLDNVLTTPDLGTVSARLGPNVGSDHYPVIVELGWR